MPDRIDLHELADARGDDQALAMFIFNAMGDVYFKSPDRREEVDGKAEVTLTINGVECPVLDTIRMLLSRYDEDVKREAQLVVENNLADINEGIYEVEKALARLRFVSGVVDCFILTDRNSRVERVIDGWEYQAAKDHIEKDEKKHRKWWNLSHQFAQNGEVKVELIEVWHPHHKRWERVTNEGIVMEDE